MKLRWGYVYRFGKRLRWWVGPAKKPLGAVAVG